MCGIVHHGAKTSYTYVPSSSSNSPTNTGIFSSASLPDERMSRGRVSSTHNVLLHSTRCSLRAVLTFPLIVREEVRRTSCDRVVLNTVVLILWPFTRSRVVLDVLMGMRGRGRRKR